MAFFGSDWNDNLDMDERPLCFGGDWNDHLDDDDVCFAISPSMRESIEEMENAECMKQRGEK
jgi:hypothetical protein